MRRRLVIAIAGVAAAAVALFALPLGAVLERSYTNEGLLRLQRDTVAATREIDISAGNRDRVEVPPSTDAIAVYDLNGRRIDGRGPSTADSLVRRTARSGKPSERRGGGRLIVAVPLNRNERITGAVRAERSDAALAAHVHNSWLALGGLAAFVELVAVAAAIVLSRRLARPLERLAVTAGRLGEGDFSARAPRSGVPEVDRVAIALDSTAQRLDELVTRERAFSADASHQLRTPLAALRIELEAMQLSNAESDEIEAALAQVERLQATISTLLDLARDAPRRDAAVELRPRLDQLEDRWRGPLAESGRPLRVACPAGVGQAAISARVLDEVLDVLLSNALTHGEGAVIVRVREVDDSLAIDVQDHGPGFSGDSDDAFGRRATTGEGHGIGLPLAQSLAHAEGCSLSITRSGPEPVLTLLVARSAVNPAISQT